MTGDIVRRNVRADVHPHAPARIGAHTPRTDERTDEPIRLLLTIPEAAAALRISRTKFYELLDAGEIESVHIGRSRKIPADALHDYVNRLRVPHPRKDTT
jgi:excisionase family DNA binding protein